MIGRRTQAPNRWRRRGAARRHRSAATCWWRRAGRRVSQRLPGYSFYIDPLVARVSLTDAQALATGRPMLRAMRPMTRVGRAVEKGETQGFMKIVVDAETRRVFGAAILGTGGDEAIHGVLDMMCLDS
ncbi:hypothetical protein [Sphingomonas sp. BK235]|uniref:hypothetical protein n=1 Tax=Sphingomonas sp. BK235 TaxID=2512131 RepID=UPI00104B8F95|nr:hypothetical protein [Sphingomonas sp. BK235]